MPFHCCWSWEKLPHEAPYSLQTIPFCLLFLAFLMILRPPVIKSPRVFCILRLKLPPSKILGISCCLSIKPPSERWCSCVSFWAACCCVCPQKMGGLKLGGVLAVWLEGPPIAAFTSLRVLAGLQSSYMKVAEAAYCTIYFTGWLGLISSIHVFYWMHLSVV